MVRAQDGVHWNDLRPLIAVGINSVTIRHALTAIRLGADIISMDGLECAGHPGEEDVGNFILLAKAGLKLNVPFIASGTGIRAVASRVF